MFTNVLQNLFMFLVWFVHSLRICNNYGFVLISKCFSQRQQNNSKYDIVLYNTYGHVRSARLHIQPHQ